MGIPSYFSHIVKNNAYILKKLKNSKISVDHFYLDSNSIIYDIYYKILTEYKQNASSFNKDEFEKQLVHKICLKIDEYITILRPKKSTMICFDGVAPVAKLKQQKERRFKSSLEKQLRDFYSDKNSTNEFYWDRCAITPGTNFMSKLGKGVRNHFRLNSNVIVSASDERGEGEHKIFSLMREKQHHRKYDTHVVYGLDADLIMLAINHLPVCKKIYLYRETPEFIKNIDADFEPNEVYIMDIPNFAQELIYRLNTSRQITCKQEIYRKYDYMFICFLLGNDFLPHFPALNIRYGGIDILTSAYSNLFSRTNKNLTNGKEIFWGNFRDFIATLAEQETKNILDVYKIKERMERRNFKSKDKGPQSDIDIKLNKLMHIPVKQREKEHYIDPTNDYWKERYYEVLFGERRSNEMLKKICLNYLEGLEWTLNYYNQNCIHWKWKYKYNYPPLLCDLLKYIPSWDCEMFDDEKMEELGENCELNPVAQLAYVLPHTSLNLLPSNVADYVVKNKICRENYNIEWSFCRYFWESHVVFDGIDYDQYNENIVAMIE